MKYGHGDRTLHQSSERISGGDLPIILSTPLSIAATKPKTGKQDQEKGIGICKESQSIHQVLCIDIKLSANAAELFDEFQTAKLSRWNHGSACKGSGDALLRCRRGRGRAPH
jgi:hypothetical protein